MRKIKMMKKMSRRLMMIKLKRKKIIEKSVMKKISRIHCQFICMIS